MYKGIRPILQLKQDWTYKKQKLLEPAEMRILRKILANT